ncbi:MAG: divalent metal cation transporter [Candidatus Marsarchaeota archaeon]|nr:divalent metal cation transporter [Candidatus Marsarchaeota archaeon]
MAKEIKENEKVDIQEKLKELPIEFRLRAIDRLNIRELRKKKTKFSKFLLLLALIGPGVIVMIADNDAGGVITYAQTGSIFGIGFFIPFMLLMIPVAYIVQEMTIRLAAVTGRGHAELIWKRYGRFWGAFSLGDLVIANALTLITEFIGITFGMGLFGINPVEAVLIGIAFISTVTFGLRYHKWERISLVIAAFNLIFIPLVFFAHPNWSAVANSLSTWRVSSGFTPLFLYVLLASIGTTIAPWMLFFQQSSEVDKGIIPEDINSGRRDTLIGAVVMAAVAIAIIILTGTVVYGTVSNGSTASYNIQFIISTMGSKIGSLPVDLFAIGLVDAGLIAAIAITASTSWAVGEAFNWPKSINLPFLKGRKFYIPGLVSMAFAAIIVLIPNIPLGFLNLTVQVIASVFMPAALLFLLLLSNDKRIMGKYTNKPWQNIASISIMIFLVTASSLYGVSLVFPNLI